MRIEKRFRGRFWEARQIRLFSSGWFGGGDTLGILITEEVAGTWSTGRR